MQLQSAFGLDLLPDPLFCSWLTGFIDGEGCFKAWLGRSKNRNLVTQLVIGLRADDIAILRQIMGILHVGDIRWSQRESVGNTHPSLALRIQRLADCQYVIIPLLEQYPLRAKKARDFEIWKQCVELRAQHYELKKRNIQTSLRNDLIDEFQQLCTELKNGRQFPRYNSFTLTKEDSNRR